MANLLDAVILMISIVDVAQLVSAQSLLMLLGVRVIQMTLYMSEL